MKWNRRKFSNYIKWFFWFNYREYPISLTIRYRVSSKFKGRFEVAWTTDKIRSSRFEFHVDIKDGQNFKSTKKEVFRRLRLSLSYGTNIKSRATWDRLHKVEEGKPHPIHTSIRTSSAWR